MAGITFGSLMSLVFAAGVGEAWRGARQLSALLAVGREAGEVFDLEKLTPGIPSPERNAAIVLLPLTNQLEQARTILQTGPPLWQFDSNRRLRPIGLITEWEIKRTILEPDERTNQWSAFEGDLAQLEPLLDRVLAATRVGSYHSGFDYGKGFKDFELRPMTVRAVYVGDLLAYSFVRNLRNGKSDRAKVCLRALLGWSDLLGGEKLIVVELIRARVVETAVRAIRLGLEELQWSDEELAEVQSMVAKVEIVDSMIEAYEMERAMTLDFYRGLESDPGVRDRQMEMWTAVADVIGDGWLPSSDAWMKSFQFPVWAAIWCRQDCHRAMHQWNVSLVALRSMRHRSWGQMRGEWEGLSEKHHDLFCERHELKGLDLWRYLFSSQFMLAGGLPLKILKLETERQMALGALALRRFRFDRKRLPEEFSELLPDYVSQLPIDCMNGEALRYLRSGRSGFVLYSVGEDGVDDLGDSSSPDEVEYFDIWTGRDVCWPRSAILDRSE